MSLYRNLVYAADFIQISPAVAAGTSDTLTFTEVNFLGQFDSVLFLVALGAVTATAVGTLRAKGTNTSASYGSGTVGCFLDPLTATTAAPLGATIASALCFTGDSNKMMALDIYRPQVAYARAELVRATANIAVLSVTAIMYNSHSAPYPATGVSLGSGGTAAAPKGEYVVSNPNLSTT
jgi:hypothetical protein